MTTAVLESPLSRSGIDARPSLARLTAVELRKMIDTRAGLWLLLGIVGLTVTVIGAWLATVFFGNGDDPTLKDMFALAAPSALLARSRST